LKRLIHTYTLILDWSEVLVKLFGSCIHWKLLMLKIEKELYKTVEQTWRDWQSAWYFMSMLKSDFEACCIHGTLLMLRLGSVNQTRKVFLLSSRFSNLKKRTKSVGMEQVHSYMLLSQPLLKVSDTAYIWRRSFTLQTQNIHCWKGAEDFHSYTFSCCEVRFLFVVLLGCFRGIFRGL